MPYIKADRRISLSGRLDYAQEAGELNYLFTELITRYCREKTVCYQTINDVIGALEGAKLEFYRRVAKPYEDFKIAQNGDTY